MSPRLLFLLFFSVAPGFGQWISIGPDGGSAHVLAIDARDPRHLLAGSRNLLLYRSEDAGESWHALPEFAGPRQLYQATLNVVAIDAENSRTYYAGLSAANGRLASENGAGLYKSIDSGKTWTRIPSLAGVSVYCLATWEKDQHVMVAGADSGVYRSLDSGETWEHVWPADNHEGIMSIAIDPKNSNVIYAGTPHLPWKTTDGGQSWHSIHTGMIDDSDVFSIRIDRQNPERVYASACSGIYGSLSGGAQWAKLQGIPATNRRTHVIAQDPKHPSTLYAATTLGLWKFSTRDPAWRKTMEDSINALVLDSDGVMYLAVDQRGLLKSEDGGETFHEINHGYVNRNITTMQTGGTPQQPFVYASTIYDGRWGGLFRSEDASGKWDLLANEEVLHGSNLTSFAALAGTTRLVAASFDGFLRSVDDGKTWTDLASRKEPDPAPKAGLSKGSSKAKSKAQPPPRLAPRTITPISFPSPRIHINSFKVSSGKQPYLIAATSAGLYYSTTGDEWKAMRIVPKFDLPASAVFVSPGDSGGLAAINPAGLYLSHDRGATWVPTALPYKPDVVHEIAFDYKDPSLVLAATSDGIYQSQDGGKTWAFHYGGMPKGEVISVVFHPLHHGEAYALHEASARDYGWIYRSLDGGNHWELFDRTGLGNVVFRTIAFDSSDSNPQLYGLSLQRGVFAYHAPAYNGPANVPSRPHTAVHSAPN